jgi:signal transduction histidine kinase
VVQPLIDEIESAAHARALAEVATQVAHDIRAPIAALSMAESEFSAGSEETRLLVRNAIGRIQGIAQTLLDRNRSEEASPVPLEPLIRGVIDEKRMQFRGEPDLRIHWSLDPGVEGAQSEVQPGELARVISNLIVNSVEACTAAPKAVKVSLRAGPGDTVQIAVEDNGRGMPAEILARLGERGVTHGKAAGNGLGIAHAFSAVKAWGGEIRVQSELGKGTRVEISLPVANDKRGGR